MVLRDITAPYGKFESLLYDAIIAPAVVGMRAQLEAMLLPRLPPGARLLDVGCGGGHHAIGVARLRPDVVVTGLDLSPQQVERATRRARDVADRVRFVIGSALDLPFADRSFDAVLSVASIKHWADRARGLAECVRVLRPGGAIAIIEIDRGCRPEDARSFVRGWRLPAPMRPIGHMLFRTFVAGQSIDLDDARALLAGLPLEESEVRRIEGTPGLLIVGRARGG
jgi:SAM-dependent methyltransferase